MILDFWNTKLNPVTMWPRETGHVSISTGKSKKDISAVYLKKGELNEEEYISSKKAIKRLGLPAKKINSKIKELGFEVSGFKYDLLVYHKVSHIEALEIELNNELKLVKLIESDLISSNDLKEILKVDTMQLFTLSSRHKWKKTKLKGKGNQLYFLRSQVLK